MKRAVLLVAVFLLGFVVVGGVVLLVKRARTPAPRPAPPPPAAPSPLAPPVPAGGFEMRLDVAASGSATLTFTNVSAEPRPLLLPDPARTGPEIDLVVEEGDAERLPGPLQLEVGRGALLFAPGQSFVQELPLGEYLAVHGRSVIHVERAKLRAEDPRLRSNSVVVGERP